MIGTIGVTMGVFSMMSDSEAKEHPLEAHGVIAFRSPPKQSRSEDLIDEIEAYDEIAMELYYGPITLDSTDVSEGWQELDYLTLDALYKYLADNEFPSAVSAAVQVGSTWEKWYPKDVRAIFILGGKKVELRDWRHVYTPAEIEYFKLGPDGAARNRWRTRMSSEDLFHLGLGEIDVALLGVDTGRGEPVLVKTNSIAKLDATMGAWDSSNHLVPLTLVIGGKRLGPW